MLVLLVSAVSAALLAIFATQNTGIVDIRVGNYLFKAPLYLAMFIPLIAGLIFAFFMHIIRDLSQRLTISEQKDSIKSQKIKLAEITKKVHKLELENLKLKKENGEEDENSI